MSDPTTLFIDNEFLKGEVDGLRAALTKERQAHERTRQQLDRARILLAKAAPLMSKLSTTNATLTLDAKRATIARSHLITWLFRSPWKQFWTTGELIDKITDALKARES